MIEHLYFQCYYAYLLGDRERVKTYYALLIEECAQHWSADSLTHAQLVELKKVRDALKTGSISKSEWIDNEIQYESIEGPESAVNQERLVRAIHEKGLNDLREILNDNVILHSIEHPCDPYGKVDMAYIGETTFYPVEVKRLDGGHDLVGQIMKYDLACKLKLHYHFYSRVQPVTICRRYDSFTLSELKRQGVLTLIYAQDEGRFALIRA